MKRLTTIQISFAAVLLSLGVIGCHDPRISVYEFMQLQEEYARRDAARMKTCPSKPCPVTSSPAAQTSRSNEVPSRNWNANSGDSMGSNETIIEDNAGSPVMSENNAVSNDEQAVPYYDASRDTWVLNVQQIQPQQSPQARYQTGGARGQVVGGTAPGYGESIGTAGQGGAGYGPYAGATVIMAGQPMAEFGNYIIGPTDVLRVSLTGLTGIETLAEATLVMVRVNSNGEVNLPLVGPVKVGGMNIEAAERAVRDAYVPKYVPSVAVSIDISQYASTDIVVLGAAMSPGIVQLPQSRRDAVHAVAAAGGMTSSASGWVTLQRAKDPANKVRLYLRDSFDLKSALAMEPLESGDIINIEAAEPNAVYIGGLVNYPGTREFPAGVNLTLLQALAAAGGVIEDLIPTEGTLVRRMPDGEDVQVKLDLDRTKRGLDPNIKLAAGDILWVPMTASTKLLDFCNRVFFLRAGATVSYNVTGIEYLNRPAQQNGTTNNGNTVQNQVDPLGFLAQ